MPAKARPDKSSWFRGWLLKSVLLFVLVAGFLGGLIGAGRWGLEHLRGRDRYDMAFTDIECVPPVGMDKQEFLHEVLYESRLPKRLHLLDEDLPQQLRDGFARHPWIEKVEAVEIKPPRQVLVKLTHRTPVLAVKVGDKIRAVDGFGVLLRDNAPTRGLPVYDGAAKPPQGPAGTRWGDPNVEAAARERRQ